MASTLSYFLPLTTISRNVALMCVPLTPMSRCSTDRISSPPDFLSVSSATSYSLRTSGGIASTLSYSWPLKTIFRLTAQGMTRRRSEARARSTGAAARVAGSPPRPARAGARPPPQGNRSAPASTPRTASWCERGTRGRSLRGTPCPDPAVRSRTPRAGAPPATDRAHRRFQAGADTKGPDCADDRTERALDAESGVDPVLDEGHERRDGQRALRTCGRGAPQDRGGYDHPGGPHGPGPSPAAGDTSNTVAAIRPALRPRTLAFAESRSARRRAFATMFCGIAPCPRPTRNATTPVTAAVAATTTAPPRSPPPRSPLAAPAITSAAPATPIPLATSRRAASGEIRSGSSAPRSRAGSVSSSGATSCRRSKYTRAESDVPVSRLRPATASAYRPCGASRRSANNPSHVISRTPSIVPWNSDCRGPVPP